MGRPRKIKPAQLLQPIVEEFLKAKGNNGKSAATVSVYRYWLDPLAKQILTTGGLDVDALSRFLGAARERGLALSSVHQGYRTLKTFCGFLERNRFIVHNFAKDVEQPKVPDPLLELPTVDELKRVVKACGGGVRGARNRAMVLVLLDAGLRSAEVRRLLVRDWNRGDGTLNIVSGKGGKGRVASVDATTTRALRQYMQLRADAAPEDFLFVGRTGRPLGARHLIATLHHLSSKASIPEERRLHPHMLRHAGATAWAREGMPGPQIQAQLGHTSYQTTLRYLHLAGVDTKKAHMECAAVEKNAAGVVTRGSAAGLESRPVPAS